MSARRGAGAPISARIGEIRPARSAGQAAPASVAISPVTTAATAAPAENSSAETGIPKDFIASISSTASPAPSASPSTEPASAEHAAPRRGSTRATRTSRGAERAQRADLAHALQHRHVERVEDQERADEQRDAREEVEDDVERGDLLLRLLALGRRRRDLDAAPERGVELAAHGVDRGAAASTVTSISSQIAGLSITLRASASGIEARP